MNITILGANYGILFASKLLIAGHDVTLVGTALEVERMRRTGIAVRYPLRGSDRTVVLRSQDAPGALTATTPIETATHGVDLIALAMQEPHYSAPELRDLICRIGADRIPTISLTNMPMPCYLRRLPHIDTDALDACFTDFSLWDAFDPRVFTHTSPDPQAYRPDNDPTVDLTVGLASNFKIARFETSAHNDILERLARDVRSTRIPSSPACARIRLPVQLMSSRSLYAPMAKWPMLIAGNYRCVRRAGIVSIHEAIHADLPASRHIYDQVASVCTAIGMPAADRVPFDAYANASLLLTRPSSFARALEGGVQDLERVDRLMSSIAEQCGMQFSALQSIVALIDDRLGRGL